MINNKYYNILIDIRSQLELDSLQGDRGGQGANCFVWLRVHRPGKLGQLVLHELGAAGALLTA